MATSCAPALVAPINTGGLLTRSFTNYSQSTVVSSERLMTSKMPEVVHRVDAPKQTSRHDTNNSSRVNSASNLNKSIVVVPSNYSAQANSNTKDVTKPTVVYSANVAKQTRNYPAKNINNTPTSAAIEPRATGIPKVTESAVSEMRNVTFVTPEQHQAASITSQTVVTTPTKSTTSATKVMTARQRRALAKKERKENKRILAEQTTKRTFKRTPNNDYSVKSTPESTKTEIRTTTSIAPTAMIDAARVTDAKVMDTPASPSFFGAPTETSREPEAVAPPVHNFKPLEIEHVKYSYYDPFGKNNNRFIVILNEQRFCYPIRGKYLSGYGPRGRSMHTGLDIKGQLNDTLRAAFAGTVRMSKPYSGYGNCIVIRHKNGLETLYSHNNRNLVKVGERVLSGDPIALIGRTGRASTEHCHFEVRIQGQHINPALILDYQNHRLRGGVLVITKQSSGKIVATNRSSGSSSETYDNDDSETITSAASLHTVRSGDTLSGIAVRHGTTITKICTLNNIDRDAILSLGKRLKLR